MVAGETAGNPALSEERRRHLDGLLVERERSRRLLSDECARESFTTHPDGGADTTSPIQQLGRPLSCAEIKRRLLLCNSNLHFEISNNDPRKCGIYVIENRDGKVDKRFVCGMESGISPEFSIRHYDNKRIPDPDLRGNWKTVRSFVAETRGWRTVLAMLLRSRLITEPQIALHFNPAAGRSSEHWQLQTT